MFHHKNVYFSNNHLYYKQLASNFCNKVYIRSGVNHFWNVKNSVKVLDKLKKKCSVDCKFDSIESYDFSTLYTNRLHKFIRQVFIF